MNTSPETRTSDQSSGSDTLKRRVLQDCEGDVWFEIEPDRFVIAGHWSLALLDKDNPKVGDSYATVADNYAPLEDITSRYPEVNR